MESSQICVERKAKLRKLMAEKQLNLDAIVKKLEVTGSDEKGWRTFFYNIPNKASSVPLERAKKLAQVFGVDEMELIIEYTPREKKLIEISSKAAESSSDEGDSGDDLKSFRSTVLEELMTELGVDAAGMAATLEPDEFQASLIASHIADARTGEVLLTDDVCDRIVAAFSLNPLTFKGQKPAAVSAHPAGKKDRKPGRRKAVSTARETLGQEDESSQDESASGEISIKLQREELEAFLNSADVKLVKTQDGRYVLRCEKSLSKDKALYLLFSHLTK